MSWLESFGTAVGTIVVGVILVWLLIWALENFRIVYAGTCVMIGLIALMTYSFHAESNQQPPVCVDVR